MLCAISFRDLKFEGIANIVLSVGEGSARNFYCNLSDRKVAFLRYSELMSPISGFVAGGENYSILHYSAKAEYETELKLLVEGDNTVFYYNQHAEQLTIFRDNFGVVPVFYYYTPGDLLIISDSLRDLVGYLKQNYQPVGVNEEKLRAYLETGIVNVPYTNDTFFSGVWSVLPGYKVSFTSLEKKEERILSFNVSQWKEACSSLDDFGNEFRRLFADTVSHSAKGSEKIGVTLSGGLDSSSIASMIRFSSPDVSIVSFFVSDSRDRNPELNKDHDIFYSSEVAKHIGTEHKIIFKRPELLEDIVRALRLIYQPPLKIGGYTTFFEMFTAMKELQIDVLVTGNDGDSIVGFGREYLTALFKEKKWSELSEIVAGHPRSKNSPGFRELFLKELIYRELRTLFFVRNFRQAFILFFESCRHLSVSYRKIVKLILERSFSRLAPSFGRGKAILKRKPTGESKKNEVSSPISTLYSVPLDQQVYFERILINHNVRLIEEYYAVSRSFDIKARFPFFSKELYELCLAVPDKLNYFGGFGRGAMRHGLDGILLDCVRLRTNKSLGNNETLRENALSVITQAKEYLSADNAVWSFVSRKNYLYNVELIRKGRIADRYLGVLLFQVNRILYVAIWLAIVNEDIAPKSREKNESDDF